MIKNNKLLIDRDCPMCRIYGTAFTHLKWIDQNTVNYYQSCPTSYSEEIDMDRAKSEIAFHNPQSGKTKYGIDAFIEILWEGKMARILKLPPIYWLAKKVYRFISFNRKVIAPSRKSGHGNNCAPQLHKGYRYLYLVISILLFGLGLNFLWKAIPRFSNEIGWLGHVALSILPFFCQYLALLISRSKEKLEHLGNMATVSNIGVLMFLPAFFISQILNLPAIYLIIALSLIAVITFKEIRDRTAILQQTSVLNLSWALGYLFTFLTPFWS